MSISTVRAHVKNRNLPMAAVEATPESVFAAVYQSQTDHELVNLGFGKPWQLKTADGEVWQLPRAKDAVRITHIGDNPRRRVHDKYLRGPISVGPDDRVVDIGAMVGEFSRRLPTDDVLAIDVDRRNIQCLRENINGEVLPAAIWCSSREKELTLGASTSESSLIGTDTGAESQTKTVDCYRLDDVINRPIDLLKVEAEGAEPEVLQGAVGVQARQIVVDVSPERNGQSPAPLCRALLEDRGYGVVRHDDILTAHQAPMTHLGEDSRSIEVTHD